MDIRIFEYIWIWLFKLSGYQIPVIQIYNENVVFISDPLASVRGSLITYNKLYSFFFFFISTYFILFLIPNNSLLLRYFFNSGHQSIMDIF